MKSLITASVFFISITLWAQQPEKVTWHSFNEVASLQTKQSKKVFIDVYTDWCGWCKKMDATTFAHPVITELLNKYFYCVKLNAEKNDTILYGGQKFFLQPGSKAGTPHPFAAEMLRGKMSYPTTVYLDENLASLGPVPGYLDAATFEKVLVFFGENHYKTTEWQVFVKNFTGKIVVPEHSY